MDDLLDYVMPCPCCGSVAQLSAEWQDCDGNWAVECSVCNLLSWSVKDWNCRAAGAET